MQKNMLRRQYPGVKMMLKDPFAFIGNNAIVIIKFRKNELYFMQETNQSVVQKLILLK